MSQNLMIPQTLIDSLDKLPKEKTGELIKSIIDFIYKWIEPKLDWLLEWIFFWYRDYFEKDKIRYETYLLKQKENWKLWWRPKKDFENLENSQKPKKPKKPKKPTWYDMIWLDINNMFIKYNINNKDIIDNFIIYNNQRKKKFETLTEDWQRLFWEKLKKLWWNDSWMIEILKQSIVNWWEWIFELKEERKKYKSDYQIKQEQKYIPPTPQTPDDFILI